MKKVLFSLILCLVLFSGLCIFAAAEEIDFGGYEITADKEHCSGIGDVNFDKTVSAADARLILRQAVALERFTPEQKAVADLDGNAMINSADARLVLRLAVKLDKQPPHITEDVFVSESTCSTQGVIAQVCIACNEIVTYSRTSVSGHLAGNWVTVKEATCSEKGLKQKVCTVCNKVLEQKDVTTAHRFQYEEGFTGPDCMNTVKAKQTCTVCGFTQTKTINPIGKHSFAWVTTTAATCSKPGTMAYKCSVCGDPGNGQTKTVSCSGAKFEQTIKEPTCTESGLSARVCYVCGEKSNEKIIAATKHSYDYDNQKITKQPTHLKAGSATVTCTKCGDTKKVEIARLDHPTEDTGVTVKAPTCAKEGIKKVKCAECGIVEAPIPATGNHVKSTTKKTVKAATCTENKFVSYYCTVCGGYEGIYKAEEVKDTKIPHTPASKWTQTKAPTCTKEGTKTKRCTVCNNVVLSEKIAKLAHTPAGSWVVTKAATCSAQGEKVKYCSVCNNVAQTATIAKTAHTPASTKTVIQKATCTAQGVKAVLCTVCKEAVSSEIIPKTAHTPGSWQTVSQATCSKQGQRIKLCTVCKDIAVSETIPATDNHSYPKNWTTTRFATCVSQGEARRYCTTNGCTAYETKALAINSANHASQETYKVNEQETSCREAGYTGDIHYACCNALKESGQTIAKLEHTTEGAQLLLESFATINEDGTISAGMKCIRCTVCSEITYSEEFEKIVVIDSDSLFKALPESVLTNTSDAVLYFEINGDSSSYYDISYTYEGIEEPVIFTAQGGDILSVNLTDIPEDVVIYIAVATYYPD